MRQSGMISCYRKTSRCAALALQKLIDSGLGNPPLGADFLALQVTGFKRRHHVGFGIRKQPFDAVSTHSIMAIAQTAGKRVQITDGFRAVYEARGWSQPTGSDLIDPLYRKPPMLVPFFFHW